MTPGSDTVTIKRPGYLADLTSGAVDYISIINKLVEQAWWDVTATVCAGILFGSRNET